MNIVHLKQPSKLPDDFASLLCELIEQAKRGEVSSCVIMASIGNEYVSFLPSSLSDSLVLSQLLNQRILDKFYA